MQFYFCLLVLSVGYNFYYVSFEASNKLFLGNRCFVLPSRPLSFKPSVASWSQQASAPKLTESQRARESKPRYFSEVKYKWNIASIAYSDFSASMLISCCGDINPNPGPNLVPCTLCQLSVVSRQHKMTCVYCDLTVHAKCARKCYPLNILQSSNSWFCPSCDILQFSDSYFYSSDLSPSNCSSMTGDKNFNLSWSASPNNLDSVKRRHNTSSFINCYYANVRSLRNKFLDLKLLIQGSSNCTTRSNNYFSYKYDILCFSETWLKPDILDYDILPPDYSIFRRDRASHAGGVLLAINKDLFPRQVGFPFFG